MNYIENRLSKNEHTTVENHMAHCDKCLDTLVMANKLMLDKENFKLEPVPKSVTQSAVDLVADKTVSLPDLLMLKFNRFKKHLGTRLFTFLNIKPWAGFQFAPVRGSRITASEDFILLKVLFEKMITQIEIEKLKNETAHIRVQAATPIEKQKKLRVTLKKGEREMASYILNDYVTFENLPFDHYNITLFLDGTNLGTYFFKIKETSHGDK